MVSEAKIEQVLNAISENGINAFDVDSFIKLVTILNKQELEVFKERIFYDDNPLVLERYLRYESLIKKSIDEHVYKIEKTEIIPLLRESINKDMYYNYLSSLTVQELADVKYYISNTVNTSDKNNYNGSIKILKMVNEIIRLKEKDKKPSFEAA